MNAKNTRPSPSFVGEDTALDFLNSVAAPKASVIDWLETGADLLDWLVLAGLCTESEVAQFRGDIYAADLARTLDDIHAFRDDLRDFVSLAADANEVPISHPMLERINEVLATGRQHLQIGLSPAQATDGSATTEALCLSTLHQFRTPEDLLARIAAAAAKFICEADFRYVRNCQGPTCTLYFHDVSKNHKRRWCSMEVCGNRAKAAAHRETKSAARSKAAKD
ncbi:CGNR zinc finger domain-containing protein [Pseudophaeobacter arcticus]|uniref:CGNR zinc finger domain-containing protein n=1 Tax=Pseudophaeobacter arcticus TaxID=385492 RepID=UPI003A969B9C